MKRLAKTLAVLALSVPVLAACGAETVETAPESTPTVVETQEPTPTVEPTSEPVSNDAAAFMESITAEPWAALVTETDLVDGRMEIRTTVVDPRGDDGSAEAKTATAICEAGVEFLKGIGTAEPSVSVFEADNTRFILAGHPVFGPTCTEV